MRKNTPLILSIIVLITFVYVLFLHPLRKSNLVDNSNKIIVSEKPKLSEIIDFDTLKPVIILDTIHVYHAKDSIIYTYEERTWNVPNFFERNENIIWICITAIFALSTLIGILNRLPFKKIRILFKLFNSTQYKKELHDCKNRIYDLAKTLQKLNVDLMKEKKLEILSAHSKIQRYLEDFIFEYENKVCKSLNRKLIDKVKEIRKLKGTEKETFIEKLQFEINDVLKILKERVKEIDKELFN